MNIGPARAALRDLRLRTTAEAIDQGDPTLLDVDGSRADRGAVGGPDAGPMR